MFAHLFVTKQKTNLVCSINYITRLHMGWSAMTNLHCFGSLLLTINFVFIDICMLSLLILLLIFKRFLR